MIGEKALDPAFPVLAAPVLRPCVPEVGVAIDDENIPAVISVHAPPPCYGLCSAGLMPCAWRATHGKMHRWLPEPHAQSVFAGDRLPTCPQRLQRRFDQR